MSRTKKDNKFTKKELVTDSIHRKAGPHDKDKPSPKICPICRGECLEPGKNVPWDFRECKRCKGEGTI